jgi:integrase
MGKSMLRVDEAPTRVAPTVQTGSRDLMVSHYEQYLRTTTNRNGRPYVASTINGYMRAARTLAKWLDFEGISGDLTPACKPEVLNFFLRSYLASHDQNGTNFIQRNLRTLFVWLEAETGNPSPYRSPALDTYTARRHKPRVLSKEFIRELLDSCKGSTFTGARDEALIRLMLDGLRIGEVLAVRIEDVPPLTHPVLRVTPSKGELRYAEGSGRRVRLADETVRALQRYLRARTDHPMSSTALRATLWLGKGSALPLTYDGVRQMLERRCERLGYEKAATCHMFRHTFAHDYRAAGGGLDDLAEHVGWSTTEMGRVYGADMAEDRAIETRERLRISY